MGRGHQLVGVWPECPASAKITTAKISSLDPFLRKFAPAKISRYMVEEATSLKVKGSLYSCLLVTRASPLEVGHLIDIWKPSIVVCL